MEKHLKSGIIFENIKNLEFILRIKIMVSKAIVSQQDIMSFLDDSYKKIFNGVPMISKPIDSFADDYLSKYDSKEKACKEMLKKQMIKCTTSGVASGLGGFITLPVAVPANIANVLYVQMRMIACCAYMAGYDLKSDQTQTLVYACLAGVAVNQILKKAGIKLGEKVAIKMVEKIPGNVVISINKTVGFRLITKFGDTGIVNLGKLVPGVGAVVGGGLDYLETKIIAERAYKWFFENNFDEKNSNNHL